MKSPKKLECLNRLDYNKGEPVWVRVVVAQEVVCASRLAPCAVSLNGANTLCFQLARQGLSTDELELIAAGRQKVSERRSPLLVHI